MGVVYDERLGRPGLYSLEFRRVSGILCGATSPDKVNMERTFSLVGESRAKDHF